MTIRKQFNMRLAFCAIVAAAVVPSPVFASCGLDLGTSFKVTTGYQAMTNGVVHQSVDITNLGSNIKGTIYLMLDNMPAGVVESPYTWTSTCQPSAQFIRVYLGADNLWVTGSTKTLMLNFYNAKVMPVWYTYHIIKGTELPSPHVVPGDYDGDMKADFATHDSTTGKWSIHQSTNNQTITKIFGNPNIDHSVVGDFDGDLKEDLAIYRPSTGAWFIIRSSDNQAMQLMLGTPNVDIPVPADYDGDGYTDLAVFNKNTGVFTIRQSYTGQVITKQFGMAGDKPVPADFDSDGRADFAVFRPSNHTFYILTSGVNQLFAYSVPGFKDGVPFAANINNDGRADFATYNASTGKVTIGYFSASNLFSSHTVNLPAKSIVAVADFNGDLLLDAATYDWQTAQWAINSQMTMAGSSATVTIMFGTPPNDIPVMTIPAMMW